MSSWVLPAFKLENVIQLHKKLDENDMNGCWDIPSFKLGTDLVCKYFAKAYGEVLKFQNILMKLKSMTKFLQKWLEFWLDLSEYVKGNNRS